MYQHTKSTSSKHSILRKHRKRVFPSWCISNIIALLSCVYFCLTWNKSLATAALSCYECDSSSNFTCTERWDPSEPTVQKYLNFDCSHVHNAKYCVKMTGIYDGKLGTKRFCSSRDWGNYCEYIKRPGDTQEYRSCIFSCTRSGCNTSSETITVSYLTLYFMTIIGIIHNFIWKYWTYIFQILARDLYKPKFDLFVISLVILIVIFMNNCVLPKIKKEYYV